MVFTTHTPVPAGHDRFDAGLIEEHLGPLREVDGLSPRAADGAGAARTRTITHEMFCMTVLGLKLSRRANAVSALHGEVSREMWMGLFPGRAEDAVPIGHITNGVHVPSWLAPQMFRLYDRHLGAGLAQAQRRIAHLGRHRKRRRRRVVGDAPEPEGAACSISCGSVRWSRPSGAANRRRSCSG